jgi:hypothetical protein
MRCYIFDLDGTMRNIDHRLHLINGSNREGFKPDWDAFYRASPHDAPIAPICHLAHALMLREFVVFLTGTDDMVRDLTEAWLNRNVASPALLMQRSKLYMRRHGDHRQDHEVKLEMLTLIKADGFDPIMAFEDRDAVVAMWRAQGITCAQVAPGNF